MQHTQTKRDDQNVLLGKYDYTKHGLHERNSNGLMIKREFSTCIADYFDKEETFTNIICLK